MNKFYIKNCPAIHELSLALMSDPPQYKSRWLCGSTCKECKDIDNCPLRQTAEKYSDNKEIMSLIEVEET